MEGVQHRSRRRLLASVEAVLSRYSLRYCLKCAATAVCFLITGPFAILSRECYRRLGWEDAFDFFAKFFSHFPGKTGQYLRTSYYLITLDECHCDLAVAFGSFFSHPNARVGRGVVIGANSIIGTAVIGDNVLIGSRVSVLSGKYQHGGALQTGGVDSKSPPRFERVEIGEKCWLGEGCIVMASIGAESVVSAGSVVNKPLPPDSIAVGNPARALKKADFAKVFGTAPD